MAEKKKWAPTKMFLQWCLSYLLISVIALTLLLASGYRYLDVLRDNLEYTNGIQLDMTRVWLDQKLKLLRNITAKESSTAAIEAVRQADDYDDIPRYDYYMLTREISTDVINYGIGDAYFLYFPSTDAIVSNTKYGQSRRFYDLVLEAYDISYEDWMEILKQDLVTTRVFQPVVQGKDSKNYLVLMRPLNITSREPDKAVAVMIVDLEDLFKASDWLNNDTLCINDRNNGVLVANHELPEATEKAVTELIKSSGSRKFDEAAHITSKGEYISIISSTYENWDIAVILKEQVFASKIIDIQKLLVVVVIIYLLLTVAVIANSAAKRYLKLRNIVQVLHSGNAADPEENLTDAFAYIDSRVQKLVQDNVESSDLIEQQRTAMLREQFHALITNADAANEADTDRLENLGFPIHRAKQYYLLAYRLQKQDLANEKDPDKIYEMQWFILQNVTRENLTSRSLENLCFREGGTQLYIIWTEKEDPEMLESILWSYEYCRSFLAQHFEFRYDIAVSGGHTGIDGVYKAYREVCRVYQYQQRTQDTGTIFYSDLKVQPSDTTVRYPVETENKLHLAIRSGDESEACTQIQALMRQNQENYLSPAGMQFLVGKIMSTIVRAGEQRSDETELAENQNRVMEAARRGNAEAMEQALCRLAGTVCHAVRASEQEAAADEKGRLYLEMRDYIEANYSDATLNVNALSEHFDRPAPFVSRYFKEMNGTNLTQYIHKVRLEHVKEKLLQDEKLETIAVTCGFGSLRSFLRIFKQYEGVTPTQYRELHGKKEETTNENI